MNGRRPIVFNVNDGFEDLPVKVPCGQCIGCRLERSRQWAIRCVHEASLYEANCFITLTYDDEHLPRDRSLDVSVFQKFMKRLRKRFGSHIRFFHCGEYGEQFGRPHYHACIFNFDFADKYLFTVRRGNRLYKSPSLEELWPFGYSSIGDVTFESAAYVARYIMKKVTGAPADAYYSFVDDLSGEVFDRKPEYTTMSRRPGVGKGWLEKYRTDVFPSDFIVLGGRKMRPPKFYDRQFEADFPSDYEKLRKKRVRKGKKRGSDNTPERLRVREKVQEKRVSILKRECE